MPKRYHERLERDVRTINLLTCMIVSKLKPMPFHSVNSPALFPVNRRRPSGVHCMTLIGCLTLLREECKCLVGRASAGEFGFAAGGSIYQGLQSKEAQTISGDQLSYVNYII